MEDLSSLAKDSMWVTAQEGGNRASARPHAMSAPGSEPANPVPQADDRNVPEVKFSGPQIPVSHTGKPDLPGG